MTSESVNAHPTDAHPPDAHSTNAESVRQLTLADLIEGLSGRRLPGLEVPVRPVIDSREAEVGSLFFAFEGENVDGHDYVEDAFDRGAVAAVIERDVAVDAPVVDIAELGASDWASMDAGRFDLETPVLIRVPEVLTAMQDAARWWRRQINPRVVGVTGSVGKTTTKEVTASVLRKRYQVLRNPGSFNNEIGLPLTLLSADGSCERLVLEMGMYVPGDIRFLCGIAQPHVGVVTNVESVHAERAGSIDEIALGKRELVEALPSGPLGVAVLNFDDPRVRAMAEHTEARVFYYGRSPEADLWADEVESLGLEGLRVHLHCEGTDRTVSTPLPGQHSVQTVLRAAAVGWIEGLDWDAIAEGLREPGPPLRLIAVFGRDDILILDDAYNSSPPSALAALDLLDDLDRRKVAVLGDMLELGDYETEGHLKVGCRAAEVVSELVVVGPLARRIAEGARSCGLDPERVHIAVDSEAAVEVVEAVLKPGDAVLVKGSHAVGMEAIVAALKADGA